MKKEAIKQTLVFLLAVLMIGVFSFINMYVSMALSILVTMGAVQIIVNLGHKVLTLIDKEEDL